MEFSIDSFLAQMQSLPGQPSQPPQPLPHPAIPDPESIPPSIPWWMAALAGLAVLVLAAFVLWLMFRPKAPPSAPRRDPLKLALRTLRELRSRLADLAPDEIGRQVSQALRVYYLERYGIPAPFRTTPELFPETAQREQGRIGAWRERFEPLAEKYDELAFAPEPATEAEAGALIESAIKRLEEEKQP